MTDIRHAANFDAASEDHNEPFEWAVAPDDRLGPKPPRRRRKVLRRSVLLLGLAGLGYGVYDDPARLTRAWTLTSDTLGPALQQAFDRTKTAGAAAANKASEAPSKTADADNARDARLPPADRLADAPPADAKVNGAAALDATSTSPPRPASTAADTPAAPPVRAVTDTPTRAAAVDQPYAAPVPDALDRFGARARSVGLHPDLSRALLADLTNADFRNADTAIRKALSQTSDAAVVKWPRQREDGQALFEVRFVSGAAPGCRRYVVTVEKHKWLTTAPPLETCTVIKRAGTQLVLRQNA
jgi:hypothetical protein